MIKSILENEGIPAMVSSESYGRLMGGVLGFCDVHVLVRPDDVEKATEILSEVSIEPVVLDDELEDCE